MTWSLSICIIFSVLFICSFIFFITVYFSELKREKQLREAHSNTHLNQINDFLKTLPVVLVDQSKESINTDLKLPDLKHKKDIN